MARELEGQPFHLLAAHCQNDTKANVVGYIRSQGLAEDTPNMTVTSFGGHPGVKGNGSVPYYIVFDHTGKMRHHHMCGAYHGGDGLRMIEWVHNLLDEAPAIWLGETPFTHVPDLAKKVESGKGLGAVAIELETNRDADEAVQAERTRLLAALTTWRDREQQLAERLMGSNPKEVLDAYGTLAKTLKGSALAKPVDARIAALKGSKQLADSIKLQKTLEKTKRKIAKLKLPKEAKRKGLKAFSLDDPLCRKEHAKTLAKSAKKLREAIEGHEALPIAKTIATYAKRLDG